MKLVLLIYQEYCLRRRKESDISFHFDKTQMGEHIDENRIRSDLRYRFEYLSKYLDFTQQDVRILNSLAPILLPVLPSIVEQIYAKLYSFDITRNYFLIRHDGFQTYQTKNPKCSLLAVQTSYRKDMLSVYFQRVLMQTQWDETFLTYLSRVAEMHTVNGGSTSINVDYTHINLLLTFIQNSLTNFLWNSDQIEMKNKFDIVKTIGKLFCIQNDFFTYHYISPYKAKLSSTVPICHFTKCCFH